MCGDATKLKTLAPCARIKQILKHHGLLKQHQKSSKVKAIMGHFLQMNTLRTGQAEVGGSNESGQEPIIRSLQLCHIPVTALLTDRSIFSLNLSRIQIPREPQ